MKPYTATNGKPVWNEFITPVGRVAHVYHDKPQLKWKDERQTVPDLDPKSGFQLAEYKCTLVWPKELRDTALLPLRTIAQKVIDEAWPIHERPVANGIMQFVIQPFLRDGDNPEHNTKAKDYLFGHYYLNFKQKADMAANPANPSQVIYSGAPGIIGPSNEDILPLDVYPGSFARVSGVMFGTEYMGKHFVSTRLNNIQKSHDGERIGGGGRPDARSQFDPLTPQGGLGGLPPLGGGLSI